MNCETRSDREVVYKFHPNDKYVSFALLWSAFAWVVCIGALFMHIAGVGSMFVDVVAFGLSVAVGLAWCVIVFIAEW